MKRMNEYGSATVLFLLGTLCAGAVSCESADEESGDASQAAALRMASESAQTPDGAWTLEDIAPNTADGLRVLIIHDMEGLSGQDDPRSYSFGTEQYPSGQRYERPDPGETLGEAIRRFHGYR